MGRPNRGQFRKGHDPRRRLWTREECRFYGARGFNQTLSRYPELGLWLFLTLRAGGYQRWADGHRAKRCRCLTT